MGRRKIEIKPIKDDRNRSVTFLKRKGGLFKKAHELSVLCSVDVAVIIFGNNNKKLFEYSSGDIQEILHRYSYYGAANEHKGPADFNGKKDDDDDDDEGSPPSHQGSVEPHMMAPQFTTQPQFQHLRNHTESPPIPNGVQYHIQRQRTPQPQPGARPDSQNGVRRTAANLAPPHMAQLSHSPPNSFAYIPNPGLYQPHNGAGMPHPHQGPPYSYAGPPQPQPPPPPQHQLSFDDQRRSMLPHERQSGVRASPQPPHGQLPSHQLPQPVPQPLAHAEVLEPVTHLKKSKSIFTPIDDGRSVLNMHWQSSTTAAESRTDSSMSSRAQSVDVAAVTRNGAQPSPPPPPPARAMTNTQPPIRRIVSTSSVSSGPDLARPPARSNSTQRPRLILQIPDEQSDGGDGTADASSGNNSTDATGAAATRRMPETHPSSAVVLPPPSPSAQTLLSAGASGPPNPFARPHPPSLQRDSIETPVSALPSRFMPNEYLPSPSTFYPDWGFRGSDSTTMHSPLNFQTPVIGTGPSFLRDDRDVSTLKRKTPETEDKVNGVHGEANDNKRAKHD